LITGFIFPELQVG